MEDRIQNILDSLTMEEKVRLVNGVGSWFTYDCNGKLPSVMMSDGPHGLRKQQKEVFSDINNSEVATCFPTASAVASSWDPQMTGLMAHSIAREAIEKNVSIVLGCGVNMKRSPLCGRNFEYFSEDPYLAGQLGTEYIRSMQAAGIGTSLKHFAANNQETKRQTSNSQIDERALREIYLSAFEHIIKEAKPWTIMASYNRLNGTYACASPNLLTKILREEWGYDGTVVSDWGAVIRIVECIKAGMDLEMPDSLERHPLQLKKALKAGSITEKEIDCAAGRVIQLLMRIEDSKPLRDAEKVNGEVYSENHENARRIARESAVLLKNDGMLPMEPNQKIAVIGDLAVHMRFQGGGSSHITTQKLPNTVESLKKKGFQVQFEPGYHVEGDKRDRKLEKAALELAKTKIPILFFAGLTDSFEGEGYDRKNLEMPSCQLVLLQALALVNPNITVVTFGGSPMRMPFLQDVNAVLHMYLGGEAVDEACADLICGDANPCGKLAETFPCKTEDIPCYGWFGRYSDDVEYRESIFMGYRYYDTFQIPVQFSFGYGLSYTEFKYSNLSLVKEEKGDVPQVMVTIGNSGNIAGSEVVQVYVSNPKGNFLRAKRELRGFQKVFLQPGEEKTLMIPVSDRSFSIYDVSLETYRVIPGKYVFQVASALDDIRLEQEWNVEGDPYERDDREKFRDYYMENIHQVSKEQFEELLGHNLSSFDDIQRGQYTMENCFADVASKSLFGKLILPIASHLACGMNRSASKNDPAVKMVLQGLREGPLESLMSTSGGMLPEKLAEMMVYAANKQHGKAIGRLFGAKSSDFDRDVE